MIQAYRIGVLAVCFLLLTAAGRSVVVQATGTPDIDVVPREQAIIRAGPGDAYAQIDRLRWQDTIYIEARSRSGLWVSVRLPRGDDTVTGWVPTGYLIFAEGESLAGVAVDEQAADADPAVGVESATLAALYAVPVVSEIAPAMQAVYARGQANGHKANTITKIGDSIIISPIYLLPFNDAEHNLGPYAYLQPTLDYFYGGVIEDSAAARIGLTSWALFDPLWATADVCEAGETPLACELRRSQPAFAFVAFGPNDVSTSTASEYAERITAIVETALDAGTIPILSTFSVHPDDALWWQALDFNRALTEIAAGYDVPLLNLWAAARLLPEYGLDEDDTHLLHSGFTNLHYTSGHDVYYGVSLQNLLALVMLDELRRALDLEAVAG